MWQDTKDGVAKEFITKQKETVLVEIKRREAVGVVHRNGQQVVICGVRDNRVKVWNDLMFDAGTYSQIKAKMSEVAIKKTSSANKGRR